ncbi:uncharacterized protein LOC103706767 isoform X2 [Phoenix dactylifera]|uniref:Uncharacterized protein LOC103706767 isoform X2 n=1 Tax=Phoenix dactylifera TaxID=42345 RepID=A0A8B7MTZ7_PHODC|nr:uncharacterized protein LOC103706767 isoform X2 [Phoenix dactylifera]
MRIRRRLPLPPISSPLPPPPPEIADPCVFQLQAPNKGEETEEKGVGGGGGGEGLHPVGDLRKEPHGWVMDPINWDPSPSASHPTTGRSKQGRKPPFFPPTLSHAQVLKEVKEEEMVDSNKRWNAQVNSNKSSSALVSEEAAPGERVLLPKKRRGGDDDNGNGHGRREEKTPKSKARAKASSSQVENDCTTVHGGENKRADAVMVNGSAGSNGKKRRRPAVLMEGSRCSRVNGRGWRCCQQTLVGYSLCEHHLGKGRLRSMSGVRVQAGSGKPKKSTEGGADGAAPLSSPPQEEEKAAFDVKQCTGVDKGEEDMEEEEEEEKQVMRKRRKKIGMVKARTISSLLDETNHSVQSTLSPLEPAPMPSINEGATIV